MHIYIRHYAIQSCWWILRYWICRITYSITPVGYNSPSTIIIHVPTQTVIFKSTLWNSIFTLYYIYWRRIWCITGTIDTTYTIKQNWQRAVIKIWLENIKGAVPYIHIGFIYMTCKYLIKLRRFGNDVMSSSIWSNSNTLVNNKTILKLNWQSYWSGKISKCAWTLYYFVQCFGIIRMMADIK